MASGIGEGTKGSPGPQWQRPWGPASGFSVQRRLGHVETHSGATPSAEPHEGQGLAVAVCLLLPARYLLPLLTSFCSLGLGSAYCERILSPHPKPRTYSQPGPPRPGLPLLLCLSRDNACLPPSLQSPAWAWHRAAVQQMLWNHTERREALLASGQGWTRAGAWEGASAWLFEGRSQLLNVNLCPFLHRFPLPAQGRRCPPT